MIFCGFLCIVGLSMYLDRKFQLIDISRSRLTDFSFKNWLNFCSWWALFYGDFLNMAKSAKPIVMDLNFWFQSKTDSPFEIYKIMKAFTFTG